MRFLDNALVGRLLTLEDSVAAIEAGFRALAEGKAAMQARVRTQATGSKLSTLGAVLDDVGVMGSKVYATTPDGDFRFLVLLFDAASGEPLAVMQADEVTALRTAATSVVAARTLARPDSRVMTVFGAGVQASSHLRALAAFYPLEEIRLVHRRTADDFIAREQAATGARIRQVLDAAEAVSDADLVVTATRAHEPLFPGEAISPGTHVTAVGATRAGVRELDDELLARASVIAVEWRAQAQEEAGDLIAAAASGVVAWDQIVELADLVSGSTPGRMDPATVTVFESIGVGIEDVAVALAALRAAEHAGLGTVLW